jgi:predicted anti-sigma-YlaC factor YlaD
MSMSKSVCSPAAPRREAHQQHAQHVSPEFLGLHVLGDLTVFQRLHVVEHLSQCGACRNQLRRVAGVIAVFRAEA